MTIIAIGIHPENDSGDFMVDLLARVGFSLSNLPQYKTVLLPDDDGVFRGKNLGVALSYQEVLNLRAWAVSNNCRKLINL